ncbi:MAG: hypothetical protein IJV65_00765 [Kiritimatiellae bacterium]|nr:hypothetical protein [Kiritimatiellia bacterium]
MDTFADTLTARERRRGRLLACFACWFGCISEVMVDSSAIVILYLSMMGGSKSETMLSTGFSAVFSMLAMIPCAALVARVGLKRAASAACLTGCAGFLLMAAAPFFGPWRKAAAMAGCLVYCAQRALYGAAWYPMLDVFLRPQDRGRFFGTMRFTYMVLSGTLFYFVGRLMGEKPSVRLMQGVLAATGLLILGRLVCMLRFPENPAEESVRIDWRRALGISIRNGPLVAYSVYVCLLSAASTSIVPLTLIYLKNHVGLDAGRVQVFSTVGIAGSVAGFFCYGSLLRVLRLRRLETGVHLALAAAALVLAFAGAGTPGFLGVAGAAYFVAAFAGSVFMCNNSAEYLALARPGNKPMAVAFLQTYQNVGVSVGRAGTAAVLGADLLAPTWRLGPLELCSYQTLFLLAGAAMVVLLALLPTLPAFVPRHDDYYEP